MARHHVQASFIHSARLMVSVATRLAQRLAASGHRHVFLITGGGAMFLQPKLKFWLLDEGRFSAEYLEGLQRVMAAILRMAHTHDTDDAKRAIRYLGQAVAQSPFKQTIDRAVMQWMQYRLSRKMPGLPLPQRDDTLKETEMLETSIDQWKAKAVAEGMLLGEQKGLQIGKLEGKIEAWFDTAVTAPDIASVFAPAQN